MHAPAAFLVAALAVAACSGAAGSAAPSASAPPAPTTSPAGPVTQEQAVALVLAQDPGFAGIGPIDPDIIGQGAWYEVSPAAVGWRVTITKGWGDCPAGCIYRHTWIYDVGPDGTVSLVEETGDPLEDGSGGGSGGTGDPGGGSSGGTGDPGGAGGEPPVAIPANGGPWIAGLAHAGPACPVLQDPPDPACAERPVAGAAIVVRDTDGREIATARTAADGTFLVAIAAGGVFVVEAQPVDGLMGTPGPAEITVADGASSWAAVDLAYDTGIR